MKRAVVDASVALKWFLPDEEGSDSALKLLQRFVSGRLELLAPCLLEYEVVNSLVIAGRRGRIGEEIVERAIESFFDLGVPTRDLQGLHRETFMIATKCRCSGYDAAYVALAQKEGIPLITVDVRLATAAGTVYKNIQGLGVTT